MMKRYMETHRLPNELQNRVTRWVDYSYSVNKNAEETCLSMLPEKFRTRILMHVYRSMLRKVRILKNIQPQEEFLSALVLRLNPALFIPGEFIYKQGDLSRQMYFVNQGTVQMLDVLNNVTNTFQSGSYFGEEDILWTKRTTSKRNCSCRSVGYSYLLSLSRPDFWDVLKDYPIARVQIQAATFRRIDAVARRRERQNTAVLLHSCSLTNVTFAPFGDVSQVHKSQSRRRFRTSQTYSASERRCTNTSAALSASLEELNSVTFRYSNTTVALGRNRDDDTHLSVTCGDNYSQQCFT